MIALSSERQQVSRAVTLTTSRCPTRTRDVAEICDVGSRAEYSVGRARTGRSGFPRQCCAVRSRFFGERLVPEAIPSCRAAARSGSSPRCVGTEPAGVSDARWCHMVDSDGGEGALSVSVAPRWSSRLPSLDRSSARVPGHHRRQAVPADRRNSGRSRRSG